MLIAASLAFGFSFVCLYVLLSAPARRLALDRPNERSMHAIPVPRSGGLAIAAGVAGSLAISGGSSQAPLLIALALSALSFLDDMCGLPTILRLAGHLFAAVGVVAISEPKVDPFLFVILMLGIAWFTNLFNFMDGSDGLAGGMAVLGFGAYAIAAQIEGVAWLSVTCCAIASASIAFLLFNFAPARIFLGDSGSIPLGFLAGALGLAGWQAGAWEFWFPLMVFSPFAVDATLTLLKRLWRGEKVWHAHREHYYQRLVRMGFGHRNTALSAYAIMLVCAGVALAARHTQPIWQAAAVGFCGVVYITLTLWIDALWKRNERLTIQ